MARDARLLVVAARVLRVVGITAVVSLNLALAGSASARSLRVVPFAEHWDGTAWTEVAAPSGDAGLDAVAAPSATDVWAVGPSSVAVHWDGTSWHRVTLPTPRNTAAPGFYGVAAVSPDDVWAVGDVSPLHGASHGIIDHWNGERWQTVPGPPARSELDGVAALSADDVWAVGDASVATANGFERLALTLHWDGTAWKRVPSPSPGPSAPSGTFADTLAAVAGASAQDVWAVGQYYLDANGARGSRSLVLHWDGSRWTQVPTPDPLAPGHASYLSGVAAPSATGVWAVGTVNRHGAAHALSEFWDGTRWRIVHARGPALFGVSALGATDAWAVGGRNGSGVVLHWNGHIWSVQTKLDPRRGLLAVAEISPAGVWAVGGRIRHY